MDDAREAGRQEDKKSSMHEITKGRQARRRATNWATKC